MLLIFQFYTSFTQHCKCLGIMFLSPRAAWGHPQEGFNWFSTSLSGNIWETAGKIWDIISQGTLTVTVHGLWQVCSYFKNTPHPCIYFHNAKQLTNLAEGPIISLFLSCIFLLLDTCQFDVRGFGMPVIVLHCEDDVNFPTRSEAADKSCKDANTSHNLKQSSCSLAPVSCTQESYRKRNDVIFTKGL